jgi:hypothetical protein
MKNSIAKVLFDRFSRYLKSINSELQIALKPMNNIHKPRIWVRYPGGTNCGHWYNGIDINVDLQLFFLGQFIPDRTNLIHSDIIHHYYTSVFENSNINCDKLDSTTYGIFQAIGLPRSFEELLIKFDILGI